MNWHRAVTAFTFAIYLGSNAAFGGMPHQIDLGNPAIHEVQERVGPRRVEPERYRVRNYDDNSQVLQENQGALPPGDAARAAGWSLEPRLAPSLPDLGVSSLQDALHPRVIEMPSLDAQRVWIEFPPVYKRAPSSRSVKQLFDDSWAQPQN